MKIERQSGTGIFTIKDYKNKETQDEVKSLLENTEKYEDEEIKTAIEDLNLGDYKILIGEEGSLITIEVGYEKKLYIDLYIENIWGFEIII